MRNFPKRGWSWPIARISGISIQVHITFVLLLAFFCWQGYRAHGESGALAALIAVTLGFSSVLLHELGHCLTARHYGIQTRRILLLPIGGMAEMEQIPRRPLAELNITLAGPLVNFIIAGLLFVWIGWPRGSWEFWLFSLSIVHLAQLLLICNLTMGLFNLLPIFPMDGGRILRALLAMRLNYLDATRIASYVAKGVIILAVVGLFLEGNDNILLLCLFAFIWLGGEAEYRMVRFRERYSGLCIGDIATPWTGSLDNAEFADKPHLSASWPLEVYARFFETQPKSVFPVYHNGQCVGIIDTAHFNTAVEHARRRMKSPPRPA